MKNILLFIFPLFSVWGNAQNVGIGTETPAQKLDVNGNINMSGNLLVNGIPGQAGQVLMTGAGGNTAWINFGDYKNAESYSQNSTWTVPTGVTKIKIEAWGGGGGGAFGGGGAAGTYAVSSELTVTPGETITIAIGSSGLAAPSTASNASNGGATIVSGTGVYISAAGGGGAFVAMGGYGIYNLGAGLYVTQFPGQSGESKSSSFTQKNATTFVEIVHHGKGGTTSFIPKSGDAGTTVYNENTGSIISTTSPGIAAIACGGSGGISPANGGRGFAIIHW